MKKSVLVIALLMTGCMANANTNASEGMPSLHTMKSYTFQAPYSCDGSYEKSALFLSKYSKEGNAPDLLFNGACGSEPYIQARTAGDDFALISDLGDVALESLSASMAFNYEQTVGMENSFRDSVAVQQGHTYVVLIAKSDIRALWALRVQELNADGSMVIQYAVKSYSILGIVEESPGFDWESGNR